MIYDVTVTVRVNSKDHSEAVANVCRRMQADVKLSDARVADKDNLFLAKVEVLDLRAKRISE